MRPSATADFKHAEDNRLYYVHISKVYCTTQYFSLCRRLTVLTCAQILEKEGEKNLSALQNEIVKKREESNADVAAYKKQKAAEANQALYTKEYVQLEMARSLSNNTKFYFSGDTGVLGGLLTKVLGGN